MPLAILNVRPMSAAKRVATDGGEADQERGLAGVCLQMAIRALVRSRDLLVKQRVRRRERRIEDDHWVYTCLDTTMRVIYVGITSTGFRRHREHSREMAWWKDVAFVRIEHFATREEALEAEAAGIALHQPIRNTIGIAQEAV
jgi:predicted GIY-YIG superfamily endonuclease